MRTIPSQYADPLEVIWLRTAAEFGFQVERDPEVFAAWDGRGTLRIGTPETLDPDDSLAQIILHEICHALVAGVRGRLQPDWGLTYDHPADEVYEHAALRLQAALCSSHGLREFFGATTDYRAYYDRLPEDLSFVDRCRDSADELSPRDTTHQDDPAHELASLGWQELDKHKPWQLALQRALEATAELRRIVAPFAEANSLWRADTAERESP